jgi:multiple sugar transport system permease protein
MTATTAPPRTVDPDRPKRPRQREATALRRSVQRNLTAYLFLFGSLACFAMFSWYPMVREFVMSFQKQRAGQTHWVGLHNLSQIWHDPVFAQAWRNTAEFTLLALLLGYAAPFFIAVVLNEFRHARGYLRLLVYLPVMLPPVAGLELFKYFYNPDYGLFNELLRMVGIGPQQWLQSAAQSMPAVVVASTWLNMGGATLIYLAALQGIPGELYEAAELDGAGVFGRIWHVTIPQTRLVLSMMLMLQVVATMQVFVEPLVLTNGAGVENSTVTVVYLIYQYAFNFNNYGDAAALGVLLLLVLVGFAAGYLWLSRHADEE